MATIKVIKKIWDEDAIVHMYMPIDNEYYCNANVDFGKEYDMTDQLYELTWYRMMIATAMKLSLTSPTSHLRNNIRNRYKVKSVIFNRELNPIEDIESIDETDAIIPNLVEEEFNIYLPPGIMKKLTPKFLKNNILEKYKDVYNFNEISVHITNPPTTITRLEIKYRPDTPEYEDVFKASVKVIKLVNDIWKELSVLYDRKILNLPSPTAITYSSNTTYNNQDLIIIRKKVNRDIDISSSIDLQMMQLVRARYKFQYPDKNETLIHRLIKSQNMEYDPKCIISHIMLMPEHPFTITSDIKIPTEDELKSLRLLVIPNHIYVKFTIKDVKLYNCYVSRTYNRGWFSLLPSTFIDVNSDINENGVTYATPSCKDSSIELVGVTEDIIALKISLYTINDDSVKNNFAQYKHNTVKAVRRLAMLLKELTYF